MAKLMSLSNLMTEPSSRKWLHVRESWGIVPTAG